MSFTKNVQETNTVEISMGGLGFTTPDKTILQTFVGSCVAICVFDKVAKTAGMAHVMLPKNNTSDPVPKPEGKFADVALEILLEKLAGIKCAYYVCVVVEQAPISLEELPQAIRTDTYSDRNFPVTLRLLQKFEKIDPS